MNPKQIEMKIKATVRIEIIDMEGIKILELVRVLSRQNKRPWYSLWN